MYKAWFIPKEAHNGKGSLGFVFGLGPLSHPLYIYIYIFSNSLSLELSELGLSEWRQEFREREATLPINILSMVGRG